MWIATVSLLQVTGAERDDRDAYLLQVAAPGYLHVCTDNCCVLRWRSRCCAAPSRGGHRVVSGDSCSRLLRAVRSLRVMATRRAAPGEMLDLLRGVEVLGASAGWSWVRTLEIRRCGRCAAPGEVLHVCRATRAALLALVDVRESLASVIMETDVVWVTPTVNAKDY